MKIIGREVISVTCPVCNSNHPHLHPAIQHEGEVEICTDDFHLVQTPQNSEEIISIVRKKKDEKTS